MSDILANHACVWSIYFAQLSLRVPDVQHPRNDLSAMMKPKHA